MSDAMTDVDSKSDLRRFGFGPEHDRLFVVIAGELWETVGGERVVRWVPDESTRVKSAAQTAARSDSEDPA